MCKTNEVLGEIITRLKSGKIRTIEINKSEKEHIYIQRCFKDIASIPQFHYRDKGTSNYNHCYFGCVIDKKPIYLFLDDARNRIVLYNMKSHETINLPKVHQDYEAIRKILLSSKSAVHYIKRTDKIKTFYKCVWVGLIVMCALLLFGYITHKVDDSRFGTIALNIVVVMALQDCINVYLPRFERKHYDIHIFAIIVLGVIALCAGLAIFFVSGAYDTIGRCNNILSIIITMGTLIIKFDKPREY